VHFDEHCKRQLSRNGFDFEHLHRFERGGDQQNTVGSGRARLKI
jgi:hypothetical protein